MREVDAYTTDESLRDLVLDVNDIHEPVLLRAHRKAAVLMSQDMYRRIMGEAD